MGALTKSEKISAAAYRRSDRELGPQIESGVRCCRICGETKPFSEFHKDDHKARIKIQSFCKACSSEQMFYRRFEMHGLTVDSYHAMAERQDFLCALCGAEPKPREGFHDGFAVDHDHASGKVRALLCHKCNKALGLLNDDSATALKAYQYLERHGK